MLEALPRVRRFARSLTGNLHDADDLVQTTVERALARTIPEKVDVARWMFKVCRNLWIDEVRAREVRRRAASDPDMEQARAASGADMGSGEATAIGELSLREVDRAMAALPDGQRDVIALIAVEGLSYREAAEVLDTPIGTVMSRLARARSALAAHFEEREPQGAVPRVAQETTHD